METNSPTPPAPIMIGDPNGPYFEELVLDETTGQRCLIGAASPEELDRLANHLLADPTA